MVEAPTDAVRFCHDGARSSISDLPGNRRVAVHPCYWKALDIRTGEVSPDVLLEIHDDYAVRPSDTAPELRNRQLGQLVADLTDVPHGREGASDFENWTLRTCRILFSGPLKNFELHPTPGGVQQRDVVATNNAESGFWKRVLDDYKTRQLVFELKNFEDLSIDDFRQSLSYSGRQYGRFVLIIHRSDAEGLTQKVRARVKELWDQHETLVMTIPTVVLARCLRKARSPLTKKRSYVDRILSKRLDRFERNYVALQQGQRS